MERQGTRFSGADWGDVLRTVTLIGIGGIGSWCALNLGRIGHELIVYDADQVDSTNVTGGQFFMSVQVGAFKVNAIMSNCRSFGCTNRIISISEMFEASSDIGSHIVVTGLDNMAARRTVFESWMKHLDTLDERTKEEAILIDGRLTIEMAELLAVRGNDANRMIQYEKEHLFSDEEAQELDCSTKQSTFGAMGISSLITGTLCNHLTNIKLGDEFRSVPFYQRMYYPNTDYKVEEAPVSQNTVSCQTESVV